MYQTEIITDSGKKVIIKESLNDILFDEYKHAPKSVMACTSSGYPVREFEFYDEWQRMPLLVIYEDHKELWKFINPGWLWKIKHAVLRLCQTHIVW